MFYFEMFECYNYYHYDANDDLEIIVFHQERAGLCGGQIGKDCLLFHAREDDLRRNRPRDWLYNGQSCFPTILQGSKFKEAKERRFKLMQN
jgi:hypothetical protein